MGAGLKIYTKWNEPIQLSEVKLKPLERVFQVKL